MRDRHGRRESAAHRDGRVAAPRQNMVRLESLVTTLDLAPAASTVVGDHRPEEVHQRTLVDLVTLADLNRPRCQVAMPLIDDAFRGRS